MKCSQEKLEHILRFKLWLYRPEAALYVIFLSHLVIVVTVVNGLFQDRENCFETLVIIHMIKILLWHGSFLSLRPEITMLKKGKNFKMLVYRSVQQWNLKLKLVIQQNMKMYIFYIIVFCEHPKQIFSLNLMGKSR